MLFLFFRCFSLVVQFIFVREGFPPNTVQISPKSAKILPLQILSNLTRGKRQVGWKVDEAKRRVEQQHAKARAQESLNHN